MTLKKDSTHSAKADQIIAEARRYQQEREKTYREQAIKLYPWVCGRCTREFTHKNLRELTVHHKDHNHDNNPPDGSNWELLCLYCHDNEHESHSKNARSTKAVTVGEAAPPVANPFAGLDDLLSG